MISDVFKIIGVCSFVVLGVYTLHKINQSDQYSRELCLFEAFITNNAHLARYCNLLLDNVQFRAELEELKIIVSRFPQLCSA